MYIQIKLAKDQGTLSMVMIMILIEKAQIKVPFPKTLILTMKVIAIITI